MSSSGGVKNFLSAIAWWNLTQERVSIFSTNRITAFKGARKRDKANMSLTRRSTISIY